MYNNVDIFQRHSAEGKKPVSKDHILDDLIYMKLPKRENYGDRRTDEQLPEEIKGGRKV